MPKANKPRHAEPALDAPSEIAGLDLGSIKEVIHFSDGSMSILYDVGKGLIHRGIEFNPALTTEIAKYLRANGIEVKRE